MVYVMAILGQIPWQAIATWKMFWYLPIIQAWVEAELELVTWPKLKPNRQVMDKLWSQMLIIGQDGSSQGINEHLWCKVENLFDVWDNVVDKW